MLSKNYQQRLEKWRNNQPTEEVELNKIDIVYFIRFIKMLKVLI